MSRARRSRRSARRRAKISLCARRPISTILAWKSARRSLKPRRRPRAERRSSPLPLRHCDGRSAEAIRSGAVPYERIASLAVTAPGSVGKAERADVPVFLVRPQHAIGEMPAVRRIRIDLRFEAEAGMRAVMRAVKAGNRAVQLGRVIELHAGLGREEVERQPV